MALKNYQTKKLLPRIALGLTDLFLSSKKQKVHSPKKILLSHPAHLGDAIMITATLAPLREAYPDIKIGFLGGSWNRVVLESQVDYFHPLDHWKTTRVKKESYWKMRKRALQEIKHVGYDVSFDLAYHFPNFAPLCWRAKIPVRFGYTSAGFSSLLTNPQLYEKKEQSILRTYFDLLGINPNKVETKLPYAQTDAPKPYVVVHIGSGNPKKEWEVRKWRDVCEELSPIPLYFTGKGERERKMIEEVVSGLDHATSLCDRLNFNELTSLIAHASYLIGVDTSAGHIAGAVKTKALLLYLKEHAIEWAPPFEGVEVFTDPSLFEKKAKELKRAIDYA